MERTDRENIWNNYEKLGIDMSYIQLYEGFL
jgi:hypothetical protein